MTFWGFESRRKRCRAFNVPLVGSLMYLNASKGEQHRVALGCKIQGWIFFCECQFRNFSDRSHKDQRSTRTHAMHMHVALSTSHNTPLPTACPFDWTRTHAQHRESHSLHQHIQLHSNVSASTTVKFPPASALTWWCSAVAPICANRTGQQWCPARSTARSTARNYHRN